MREFRRHAFTDPQWGQVVIWAPRHVDGDPYGILRQVEETPWFPHIPLIPGDVFSHAMYGRTHTIWPHLGPDPKSLGRRLTHEARICVDCKTCPMYDKARCWPQAKMPDCYRAPMYETVLSFVARAWKDGHYVAAIGDGEFTI